MILLITIPLSIAISLAWYLPGIKAQGENTVLQRKDYLIIAGKYGFLFTSLLIMLTEILWDGVIKRIPISGLPRDIFANFLRAALLEEFFKYKGFILAKKKYQLLRKIDYIMTAGMMGLVYGMFEKVVLGSLGAVIVGLLCPMHIMWQFNQGGHYFEHEKAKAVHDSQTAQKEWRMAIWVPFIFHGLWDTGLDIGGYCLDHPDSNLIMAVGVVIIMAMAVGGIIYSVKTVRKVCRIAKEENASAPEE